MKYAQAQNINFGQNQCYVRFTSCLTGMQAVIRQHNSSIHRCGKTIDENYESGRQCNCLVKEDCPLHGRCQVQSVVYMATTKTTCDERDCTGLTAQTFQQRYNAHQHSMRDSKYRNSTSLYMLKHAWTLKDQHIGYNTQCRVLREAKDYQDPTKRFNWCLAEKLEAITQTKNAR